MGVDWQRQPRDQETGRFLRKASAPRARWLKLRLTSAELRALAEDAARVGMTQTEYVRACLAQGLRQPGLYRCEDPIVTDHQRQLIRRRRAVKGGGHYW